MKERAEGDLMILEAVPYLLAVVLDGCQMHFGGIILGPAKP